MASNRLWIPTVGVSAAAAAILPLVLLPARYKPSENITYIGVLLTFIATIIGLVNTRRSEQRLGVEREEEGRRLQLDAAMRAGALLAPSADGHARPASAASGLLALTKLGQADLAVALLVDLWSGKKELVSTETAILVIDEALRSPGKRTQLIAAELLCRNATRLNSCQSLHWPSAVDGGWDPGFGHKTKLLIVDGLTQMTLAGPRNENALRSVAVRLYGIWVGDPDLRVRGCIGTLISALVPSLRSLGYTDFLQGNQKVMLADLEAAARSATANPDGFLDRLVISRSRELAAWAAGCDAVDRGQGCLATAALQVEVVQVRNVSSSR